jgi:hypothetical protein
MAIDNKIWIQIGAGQMQMVGQILQAQDVNTTGSDDMAGKLLNVGATALNSYVRGDTKGFKGALKTIADSIYAFLEAPQ